MEPRPGPLANLLGILLGLVAAAACFVGIEFLTSALGNRLRSHAPDSPTLFSPRATLALTCLPLLWPLPCYLLGRLLASLVTTLSTGRP